MSGRIITLILFIAVILNTTDAADNSSEPDLSSDRIVLKNSIAYHFIKHVRSIETEVFITRRISISPLVEGIRKLSETKLKLNQFCNEIDGYFISGLRSPRSKNSPIKVGMGDDFIYFPELGDVTFEEAKRRCHNIGMQLPELYGESDRTALVRLLNFYGVSYTFAGIAYDVEVALQRFLETGLPWWQGIHNTSIGEGNKVNNIEEMSDDTHIRFVYTNKGHLQTIFEILSPMSERKVYDPHYRQRNKEFVLVSAPLICQSKTTAMYPNKTFRTGNRPSVFTYKFKRADNIYGAKRRRDVSPTQTNPEYAISQSLLPDSRINGPKGKSLVKRASFNSEGDLKARRLVTEDPKVKLSQEICLSIASHIGEIEVRSRNRLVKLLNLIDISINLNTTINKIRVTRESDNLSKVTMPREKRSPFGLFLLKNGIRSVWSLFGFIEKVRTNRRLNRLEKDVARLQAQSEKTNSMVDHLALMVSNHSIMIGQLQVTTEELSKQVAILTTKIDSLGNQLDLVTSVLQVEQAMNLLQSIVDRTRDAMSHGFDVLEQIVDKALMSETSAHLLPVDEIRRIQVDISIFSNSILDPEYKRMKSVIVTDPENPELLLAIINMASLSRRNYELVQLTPVPLYKNKEAIVPVLSHQSAVLDQQEGTFIVLDQQELNSCLKNEHCTSSGPEQRTNTIACGIPQFFDWNKNKCDFEPVLSNGIFLKRLGADGIVFSLKRPVTAQLFCLNVPGHTKALSGSGVLQLPPGCSLSITTAEGDITKIKSLPISQVMQARDLDLIVTGPSHIFHTRGLDDPLNTSNSFSRIIDEHLMGLGKQLDDTNDDVQHHKNIVLALGVILGVTLLIIIIMGALLYRYSSRFRTKVKVVKKELQGVGDKMMAIEREAAARARRDFTPPPIPPRNLNTYLYKLEAFERRVRDNDYIAVTEGNNIKANRSHSLYENTSEITKGRSRTLPKPKPRVLYPMLPCADLCEGEELNPRASYMMDRELSIDHKARAPRELP